MKRILLTFLFIFVSLLCLGQIPTRIIVNSGFEQPSLGCTNCFNLFPDGSVAGWNTTDPTAVIEIWGNGFQSKNCHGGLQFAEINANNSAFLYQEICLTPNEVVNYSIWYLKRTTSVEQMKAQLTESNYTVISQSATYTATNTWTNYTGTLTNNAVGGLKRIGFVAVTGGSTGNLIDDITISIRPLATLSSFSPVKQTEGSSTTLSLMVNGTLLSSATVTIQLAGTATYLSDYTFGVPNRGSLSVISNSLVITLPAGDYNPNLSTGSTAGLINIPVYTIADGIPENHETITCSIQSLSGGGNGNVNLNLMQSINSMGSNCANAVSSVTDTIKEVSPLPIELLYFTAKVVDGGVRMEWETATETANDYFTVFASDDLVDTFMIGVVDGAGYSNQPKKYSFIDYTPNKYYKICQTDFNGMGECFEWVSVRTPFQECGKTVIYDIFGRKAETMDSGVYILVDEYGNTRKILVN